MRPRAFKRASFFGYLYILLDSGIAELDTPIFKLKYSIRVNGGTQFLQLTANPILVFYAESDFLNN